MFQGTGLILLATALSTMLEAPKEACLEQGVVKVWTPVTT